VVGGGTRLETHSCLSGEASSAARARAFVRTTLAEWGLDSLEEVTTLLASELVANVVLHAGTECRIQMDVDDERLKVGVWDASSTAPVRHQRPSLAATGKGLCLVDELSQDWGWERAEEGGKVVWFSLDLTSARVGNGSEGRR
jgi:anti-sigma regulatory factor (Ser/Thr protein kinase)